MELEKNGYDAYSIPWEESRVKNHVLQLINYGSVFLIFLDECLLSLTDWYNNTFIAHMFLWVFYFDTETIFPVWVPNLSEAPLPVWILS